MTTLQDHTSNQLVSVRQLVNQPQYSWLTEATLRHYIFHSGPRLASNGDTIPGNGLGKAILRVGRKVLIDLPAFDAWIESHRVETV